MYLPKCVLYVSDVHAQIGAWCGRCPPLAACTDKHGSMVCVDVNMVSCACSICLAVYIHYIMYVVYCMQVVVYSKLLYCAGLHTLTVQWVLVD